MASPNANPVKKTFKVFCKAHPAYSLAIGDGRVILAKSNPSDESQYWYKEDYGTSFALVNKATSKAIKHPVQNTYPVQLKTYGSAHVLDESIMWNESNALGGGFRAIRMAKKTDRNLDASFKEEKSGSGSTVRISTIGLWGWHGGDNQLWKIDLASAPASTDSTSSKTTSITKTGAIGNVEGGKVEGGVGTGGTFTFN